jgi:alpha-1,6-mannosyltransferase
MKMSISRFLAPATGGGAAKTATGAESAFNLRRSAALGFIGSLAVAGGAMLGGSPFETHLPGAWFFGMPGGLLGSIGSSGSQPPVYAVIAVYGGLILLTRVWIGLLRSLAAHRGVPIRKIVCVVALWAVPLLLAPPLFSRDVYSYAGQGEMVSRHIDPYVYGPSVLGYTSFSTMPDTVWINTPSPYGPTFLGLDGALTKASGHQILPDILLLRLLEVAGLALMVGALPSLARAAGRDPAGAVLLGAGSPLVLTSLIAGAHNDALMLGLLVAGLAVARRFGTVPGVVLCALATGVKAPALLGVLFLGWVWAGAGASFWRRVVHTAGAFAIAVGTLAVVSGLSGNGWGWVRTGTAADASFTAVTPIGAVSRAVWGITKLFNANVSVIGVRNVFAVIGLLVAGIIGTWLLIRSPLDGTTRALGLTLLFLALLSPILWAWYATWGIVVLAPVAAGRLRSALIVIATAETFIGVSSVKNLFVSLYHAGVLPDLVLLGALVALVLVPLDRLTPHRHRRVEPPPVMAGLSA